MLSLLFDTHTFQVARLLWLKRYRGVYPDYRGDIGLACMLVHTIQVNNSPVLSTNDQHRILGQTFNRRNFHMIDLHHIAFLSDDPILCIRLLFTIQQAAQKHKKKNTLFSLFYLNLRKSLS